MPVCSFCGNNEHNRIALIEGPDGLFICNECIELCSEILERSNLVQRKTNNNVLHMDASSSKIDFTPKSIVDKLNEYVVSQDKAKKVLAVTIYNHYKKIILNKQDKHIKKSNLLLVGPTGTGKTYLLKQVSSMLQLPFITIDTSQLTPRGYKGSSISDAWARLYNKCEGNVERMQNAIVYLDEVDKMFSANSSAAKEFYSAIQSELLKILEDGEISFTINSNYGKDTEVTIDSSNMLFIFGGAFSGIESIVEKRLGLSTKNSIGFGSNSNVISLDKKKELISQTKVEDLVEYGLLPEFVGRISNIVNLEPLTETDLVNIMTNTKDNVISQYKTLFEFDGVKLTFEPDALKEIAKKAIENNTVARGLNTIVDSAMLDLMYDIPESNIKSCKITKNFINGTEPAKITKLRSKKTSSIENNA